MPLYQTKQGTDIFDHPHCRIGLNVLTEFLVGYMLPGKPIAMMLFKTYGYITMAQALYFLQDMKFGHYLKVPVSTYS